MSSRPLLILEIVGAALAGLALLGVALLVVAIDGTALSGALMATVVLGAAGGWVLVAAWLTYAVDRLQKLDQGGNGDDGESGGGGGRTDPPPAGPQSPAGDADWWPEFERDLRAHLEANERAPVPD